MIEQIRAAYSRWLLSPDKETTIGELLESAPTVMDLLESGAITEQEYNIIRESKRPKPMIIAREFG